MTKKSVCFRSGKIVYTLIFLTMCFSLLSAMTLKQAFDDALPGVVDGINYDRILQLQQNHVYTGGLYIGDILSGISHSLEMVPGEDVRIVGNGAVLDLQGGQICISYCDNRLDITDCVVVNGNIRYRGINSTDWYHIPYGTVSYVTFYRPHDFGVRLYGAGQNIAVHHNLIVDVVDTGWDFVYVTGNATDWLPTGTGIGFSDFIETYGFPFIHDNWLYHSDPTENADSLTHFSMFCEYG